MHLGDVFGGARKATAASRALLAAAVLVPCPAAAQDGYALIGAAIVDSTTIAPAADMEFGLIMPTAAGGNVVMTASATATCATTGGLIHSGACKAAAFTGSTTPMSVLRVMRPSGDRIDLTGPGGATMRLQDFTFSSPAPTVDLNPNTNGANRRFRIEAPDGSFVFHVGGTLRVGPSQAPGVYTGTFEIRVDYD